MRQLIQSHSENLPSRRRIPAKKKTTLRRIVRCFVCGFGLALLLFLAANWTARLRFQSLVNARHRAGERVLLEDFQTAFLPDSQNAATYLEQAASCFKVDEMQPWVYYGVSHYELPESARDAVRQIFSEHPEILPLLRRADSCQKADWHVQWRSPVFESVDLKFIKRQGVLGQVLYPYGVYQHELGNDSAALECVEHLLAIARAIDQQPGFATHRAACSFDEHAAHLCLRVSLKGSSAPATNNAESEGFKRIATKLIKELADDDSRIWCAKQTWLEDRMQSVDIFLDPGAPAVLEFTSEGLRYWAAMNEISMYEGMVRASQEKRWSDAKNLYASMKQTPKFTVFDETFPPLDRLQPQFEAMTVRHAAAIALALRLYAEEHEGKYPSQLQALVPRYLRSLPSDPFGAPGDSLKYLSGDSPAVYSVSYDGIDSGGDRTAQRDPEGGPTFSPWKSRDAVFPLGGALLPADQFPKEVVIPPILGMSLWRGPH